MKVEINKTVFIVFLAVIGLVIGLGSALLYNKYGEDLGADEVASVPLQVPFGDFGFGDESPDWNFKVFQVTVKGYRSANGVNILDSVYYVNGNRHTAPIIISREENWTSKFSSKYVSERDFETVINTSVDYRVTFDHKSPDGGLRGAMTFDEVKKMFPEESNIAIALPTTYPAKDVRTEDYCGKGVVASIDLCSWGNVWDQLSSGMVKFNEDRSLSEGDFLIPFAISDNIYTGFVE